MTLFGKSISGFIRNNFSDTLIQEDTTHIMRRRRGHMYKVIRKETKGPWQVGWTTKNL